MWNKEKTMNKNGKYLESMSTMFKKAGINQISDRRNANIEEF